MRQIISFFVKNHIWSWVIVLFVLVAGVFSYLSLRKSYFPERRIDSITVSVAFPGASPEEVEEGITLKIEDALKGIPGIEQVTSSSRENSASVSVKILKGYDDDEILSDVKNAVDQINSYPEQAEKPKVFKNKPIDKAIYLSLYGDVDLIELKKVAEMVEDDFLASGLMSQIAIAGYPDLEFSIEVKEDQLLRYGLKFDDIANAVTFNNRDISGGSIKTDDEEILIRSRAKTTLAHEIEQIVLRATSEGALIRLKDVADVKLQFTDSPNEVLYNGMNSVSINISKLPEEDIILITDFVKNYSDDFNETYEDYQIRVISDRSIGLQQRIELLASNGVTGLLLVIIVLGLFLSLRTSLWVSLGIPVSFLGMIIIASLVGITINQISLFGMILVIGILVDDGIVIAENIFSRIEKGEKPFDAAVNGTMEVFTSVFASVMTTIVAFSAFFFIDGRIGEFMWEMAVVVIACLGFSLIEAALILPAHLVERRFSYAMSAIIMIIAFFILQGTMLTGAMWAVIALIGLISFIVFSFVESIGFKSEKKGLIKRDDSGLSILIKKSSAYIFGDKGIRYYLEKGINWFRFNLYGSVLKFTIRYRWFMLLPLTIFFFATTIGFLRGGFIQFSFFPSIETNSIIGDIELKPGTREEQTIAYLQEIENAVWAVNEEQKAKRPDGLDLIQSTRVSVGRNYNGSIGAHVGSLEIRMLESEARNVVPNMKNFNVASLIMDKFGGQEALPSDVEKFSLGAVTGFGKPVSIRLLSSDFEELEKAKEELKQELNKISALKDVIDNDVLGMREINLQLKPQAYFLGLTHRDVTNQVRQGFFGQEAQRLQIGADEVKVWVRYPEEDRNYISKLENMRIKTISGEEYPLAELVDYKIERGPVDIKHYNGAREILVEASMINPDEAVGPILEKVNDKILPAILGKYASITKRNSGQKEDQEKMMNSAKPVLAIILTIIYFILVLTFNSWSQPFMVIWMIPFGIMGGLLGHLIHAKAVVIMSQFGFIALLGVIINDAVVFLDRYNQLIKGGSPVVPAIYRAGISRFRPIILTSITTVAGLFPIIFEKSTQAQFLIPMAISVAYGVLFGTIFILILFPSVIMGINDIRFGFTHFKFFRRALILRALNDDSIKKPTNITREEGEPVIKHAHKEDE